MKTNLSELACQHFTFPFSLPTLFLYLQMPGLWKDCRVYLCKCSSSHLDTTLIRCIDLEVMTESAMETKQPTAREASIVTWSTGGFHVETVTNINFPFSILMSSTPLIASPASHSILSQPCWVSLSKTYPGLQDTCNGKLAPAPQPEPGHQVSALHPTSAPAGEMVPVALSADLREGGPVSKPSLTIMVGTHKHSST